MRSFPPCHLLFPLTLANPSKIRSFQWSYITGPLLVWVRRVQLHLSILGNGCMNPSIFRPDTCFRLFCLIFPANSQILHPSIEISNQGTDKLPKMYQLSQKYQACNLIGHCFGCVGPRFRGPVMGIPFFRDLLSL